MDSSSSCSLFFCYDHLLMKHSSTALLISQHDKFSHKSLVILWLLVSLQSSVDVSVKLGLGRKNTWKTFKTLQLLLIYCIRNFKYINHTIILYLSIFYLFINLFTFFFIFWAGLDWNGLLHLAFMDLGCSGWKYTAIYLRGWDFT